ncbi:MAG: DEAD/DEAH box helicase, partial [Planctomycetes bacterium]|nr:DEAD/DEAH box helicase [Planctomycetota bacterium]
SSFTVQRAALEAAVARWKDRRAESLVVAGDPTSLCDHRVHREGLETIFDRVRLRSLEPLDASCSCRDYSRNSLGLCRHILAVVATIFDRPRVLAAWRRRPSMPKSGWTWDPIDRLTDHVGPLARLEWNGSTPPAWARSLVEPSQVDDGTTVLRPRTDLLEAATARGAFAIALGQELAPSSSVDPAVRVIVDEQCREWRRVERGRSFLDSYRRHIDELRRPLYEFQRESVLRFLERGRLVIADDMGLGKTAQAIAASHALFHEGHVRRGLLIVPASLKAQWAREWALFTDVPVEIVEGHAERRAAQLARTDRGFLIINYELLLRDWVLVQAWRPDLVILDEAQRIKNWHTKTARTVKSIEADYRLILTGTPFENRLPELASVVEWVDDRALQPVWRLQPGQVSSAAAADDTPALVNLDILRARLATFLVRRTRRHVLPALPERTDELVPVPLVPEQRAPHGDLERRARGIISVRKRRLLTAEEYFQLMQIRTMQRIVANGIAQLLFEQWWPWLEASEPTDELVAQLHAPKLIVLRTLLRRLLAEEGCKVVVFSQWRRMLKLAAWTLRPLFRERGTRPAFFTGREKQRQRQQNLVAFHDDPEVEVLFSTDAGGTGLNLQRAASCVIQMEIPWNPAVREQRIARVHRLGQEVPVRVFDLCAQHSIEERLLDAIDFKQSLFEAVLDGEDARVEFLGAPSFVENAGPFYEPNVAPLTIPERAARFAATISAAQERARRHESGAPTLASILLAGLEVQTRADGSLRVDARPEIASQLASWLEGLARGLALPSVPGVAPRGE